VASETQGKSGKAHIWATVTVLGFTSGLPLLLTNSTLQAWMKDSKVDLSLIGASALLGLPYNLKFLWSPMLDAFPVFGLGRRRGWILLTQFIVAVALVAMAYQNPSTGLGVLGMLAVFTAFASASQDIAIDAYRTELLPKEDQGLGSALSINAYRVGMLVAGAFALWLADRFPWRVVYLFMAAFMLPGMLGTLLGPEPVIKKVAPRTLTEAVVLPFRDFFSRRGAGEILAFTLLYKTGDMMASALTTVFLMDLGFSKGEIGIATKGVGLTSLIVGAMIGGVLMKKWDLKKSLVVFGIVQAVSIFAPFGLSLVGFNRPLMYATLIAENLCFGTGAVAYGAFLMRSCSKGMAATQYALLSSLMALPRTVLAVGWSPYFLLCIGLAVPGLLMLRRFDRWQMGDDLT
jgi:PAT family beta-lactamase induction signal transducer AmpG